MEDGPLLRAFNLPENKNNLVVNSHKPTEAQTGGNLTGRSKRGISELVENMENLLHYVGGVPNNQVTGHTYYGPVQVCHVTGGC